MPTLTISITDEEPARLEIHDRTSGSMVVPEDAIVDRHATGRLGQPAWYLGSFTVEGTTRVDVPPGDYLIRGMRGPEWEMVETTITVSGPEAHAHLEFTPTVDMNALGWYSADLHVHRPLEQLPTLVKAERLNLAAAITAWDGRGFSAAGPQIAVLPHRIITTANVEDERPGGAWLGLGASAWEPPTGEWTPPGPRLAEALRSDRAAWIDLEKPIWWEAPVVMALARPDSVGLVNNCLNQYGVHHRFGPRDASHLRRSTFDTPAALVEYMLDLYYRYLNLGLRAMPSAGSASGVLPSPLGQNRVYARVEGGFDVRSWFTAVRAGRAFVTNGPMLTVEPDLRQGPGAVMVELRGRYAVERLELVADGRVTQAVNAVRPGPRAHRFVLPKDAKWVTVRALAADEAMVRIAHSAPIHVRPATPSRDDAMYFIRWIDALTDHVGRLAPESALSGLREAYGEARSRFERSAAGRVM